MKITATLFLCLLFVGCVDSMNWKFQTSGQSLDAVPVYEYVVRGLVLKPATPSDAKIHRDAQNNALVEWRRRGRINYHWRDRAGVPVSEENEYYEIEAYNGSVLAHTYRVPIAQAQPVQWQDGNGYGNGSYVTFATDGSGSVRRKAIASPADPGSVLGSKQLITGDFVFEFEVYNNGTEDYQVPAPILIDTAFDAAGGDSIGFFSSSVLGSAFVSTPSGAVTISAVVGDRFVMAYRQGVMTYYKNPVSEQSPSIFRQSVTQGHGPYWIRCYFDPSSLGRQGIRNPSLLRYDTPDWTYTADMQTADGLMPGDPIHLIIYQVSAQVGRGIGLEVTL